MALMWLHRNKLIEYAILQIRSHVCVYYWLEARTRKQYRYLARQSRIFETVLTSSRTYTHTHEQTSILSPTTFCLMDQYYVFSV